MAATSALVVRPRDVVHLHVVHAPRREQLEDGVVVLLRARPRHVDAEHVRVPRTDALLVGDLIGAIRGALDGERRAHRLPWNAAHQVEAELQPQRVHVVGERLEAVATSGRREPVHRWCQPSELVHRQRRVSAVAVAACFRLVPLDVDDEVLPAVRLELRRHEGGLFAGLRFGDRRAEAVPAVPAHGRCGRPGAKPRDGRRDLGAEGRCQRECDEDPERHSIHSLISIVAGSKVAIRFRQWPRQ